MDTAKNLFDQLYWQHLASLYIAQWNLVNSQVYVPAAPMLPTPPLLYPPTPALPPPVVVPAVAPPPVAVPPPLPVAPPPIDVPPPAPRLDPMRKELFSPRDWAIPAATPMPEKARSPRMPAKKTTSPPSAWPKVQRFIPVVPTIAESPNSVRSIRPTSPPVVQLPAVAPVQDPAPVQPPVRMSSSGRVIRRPSRLGVVEEAKKARLRRPLAKKVGTI